MIVLQGNQFDRGESADLFVAAVGFETRARFLLSHLKVNCQRKVGFHFEDRHAFDFAKNFAAFQRAGVELRPATAQEIRDWWERWFSEVAISPLRPKVVIDISSMTREMIASMVFLIAKHCQRLARSVDVKFVYAPARYSPPVVVDEAPITSKGPVIPELAGWSSPALPTTVVFGLGYEPELALGLLEDFEPRSYWVFRPTGHDERYTRAIDRVNQTFIEITPRDAEIRYDIARTTELMTTLESLVHGALLKNRVVLVPLGPKIFALSSMLVAMIHFPKVAVWRVSAGIAADAVNRLPNGDVITLNVSFSNDLPIVAAKVRKKPPRNSRPST